MYKKIAGFVFLIPIVCFSQNRIGFGVECSNSFVKNGTSIGIGIISQKIIKNFGFDIYFKTPTKTSIRGLHKDGLSAVVTNYSINYSILGGVNYRLKSFLITLNASVVQSQPVVIDYYAQSNYYTHFPSGPNDYLQ